MRYDSAWKEAITRYFRPFMEFFFPKIAAGIEWSAGWEFLNTQFRQVIRDAKLGGREVDVLVKVTRKRGGEAWVLIHVEVQNQEDANFPERLFVYRYRIHDRHRKPVCSLAILGDDRADWRPRSYHQQIWGCRVRMDFPIVKLLDFRPELPRLESMKNPFGPIVAAHLHSLDTTPDSPERRESKLRLIRRLYERGASKDEILGLFSLIDCLLELSPESSGQFQRDLATYEEEVGMGRYITSIERHGIQIGLEQGLEQGREQGLEQGLEQGREQALRTTLLEILGKRFDPVPSEVLERVNATAPTRLQEILVALATQPELSLERLRSLLGG